MTAPIPSEASIQALIGYEVGSPAEYTAADYDLSAWPGGESGVTIGIGEDLGYLTTTDFLARWQTLLPVPVVAALLPVVGLKGADAQLALQPAIKRLSVPWAAAEAVFRNYRVPEYAALTAATFPNCDQLSGDSFGALVSLVYNRGSSLGADPSRLEMRQIRDVMSLKYFSVVPTLILAMQRLWPAGRALYKRRAAEAQMFAEGLLDWQKP